MGFSYVDDWVKESAGAADYQGLCKYQLEKAREIVSYVKKRSIYYKERLKNTEAAFEDISQLPFTTPENLASFSSHMLCVRQGQVSRIVTCETSGTLAKPKRIFFTEEDQKRTIDFFHHGMKEFTKKDDVILILFPGKKEGSIGKLLTEGLLKLGAKPVIYGLCSDFDDLTAQIETEKPNVLVGMPQQILELSWLCRHKGKSFPQLHSVLLSADYVADAVAKKVEENLSCSVYQHYGMTEMCFGGGVQAKEREGFHMRHKDFLFEITDPLTGEALPTGEYGEIVFTSLNSEAMPLIRYKTGDLSRLLLQEGGLPVLDKVIGRVSEGLLKIFELDEILFQIEGLLDYQCQYGGNRLNVYVRSIAYNPAIIYEALHPLVMEKGIDEIRVFPMDKSIRPVNTMKKRAIVYK